MIEVHNNPEKAKTDGPQSLTIDMFKECMEKMKKVAEAVGKEI